MDDESPGELAKVCVGEAAPDIHPLLLLKYRILEPNHTPMVPGFPTCESVETHLQGNYITWSCVPSVVDMQGYWDDLGLHWPLTSWSIISSVTYPGLHRGEFHPDRHGCIGPGDFWDSAILGLVESQKTPTFNRRKTGGQTVNVWVWLSLCYELYMLMRFWNSIWSGDLVNCLLGILGEMTYLVWVKRMSVWVVKETSCIKLWCFPQNIIHFNWLGTSFLNPNASTIPTSPLHSR
jgi:hypothetical protein